MTASVEFWFEFASTYSYIAALRIAPLAQAAGVTVRWRPFLLGPIFKAQGWDTSPFNLYPDKGRYMVRDCERLAAERGLTFRLPQPFPQNSLLAARVALIGLAHGWGEEFSRHVYLAAFADGNPHLTAARKAVNCDLCDGTEPYCVDACPHDAALRIDGQGLLKLVQGRRG